jgi:hypothetical protein
MNLYMDGQRIALREAISCLFSHRNSLGLFNINIVIPSACNILQVMFSLYVLEH